MAAKVCRVVLGEEAHNIVFFAGMKLPELTALLKATYAATLDSTGTFFCGAAARALSSMRFRFRAPTGLLIINFPNSPLTLVDGR